MQLLEGTKTQKSFNPFKIKLPLAGPNSQLTRLGLMAVLYRVLLNRISLFLLLLNILGLYLVGRSSLDLVSRPQLTLANVLFYFVAVLTMGFCHELSHAVVAKSYGVNVPAVGAMFFYLHPSFYADVSGMRLLNSSKERINIVLAGVMANNALLAGSLFLYFLLPAGIAVYALAFGWINLIVMLMNLIPFVEYDGYFAFQELLGEQNFAVKARQRLWRKTEMRFEHISHAVLSVLLSAALLLSAVATKEKWIS